MRHIGYTLPNTPFARPHELVTVADLRRLTGRHVVTLRRWVAERRLPEPDFRSGRFFLWYAQTLEPWLACYTRRSPPGRG